MGTKLSLRQIDTFRQVILRGSMTAAAEALYTSQPSVSRAIAELEKATGLMLFERHAGRVVPTDAGMAFFREVEHSYRGLDSLAQSAQEIRLLGSGRLRVAAVPAMATTLLPCVIREFSKRYPDVVVALEMRSESTIQRWASAAYCDIGFASMRPDAYSVHVEDLYCYAGLCVVPQGHPWSRRRVIHPAMLQDAQLIVPSHADVTRFQIDKVIRLNNLRRIPKIETPYGSTTYALVAEGLGVGIVNPLIAAQGPPPGVVFLPFEPKIFYRGYTVMPATQRANPLAVAFAELSREVLATRFAGIAQLDASQIGD